MNEIISYYIKSFASKTQSLKKKSILIEKPWALIDTDGEIQKLIFKSDKGLILSKNGKVTEGAWDYYPEAKALLINRGNDKLLLKEQYIDENVLILKIDGTVNDFYALANENTIPDYNIPKYLNSLKCKELKIEERKLLNGNIIQIHYSPGIGDLTYYLGCNIELIDTNYNAIELRDGNYLTDNKKLTFYVRKGRISAVYRNLIKNLNDGKSIEIENGNGEYFFSNINKKVTINGNPIPDGRLVDKSNFIYEIKESKIAEILVVQEYELSNGSTIKIEQRNYNKIKWGDKIVDSHPLFPLPDGIYKMRRKWRKIEVIDSEINRCYSIFSIFR